MYRIIVLKEREGYGELSEFSLNSYPYKHNYHYTCMEVTDESFCFIKLKFECESRNELYMDGIPTYAVTDTFQ